MHADSARADDILSLALTLQISITRAVSLRVSITQPNAKTLLPRAHFRPSPCSSHSSFSLFSGSPCILRSLCSLCSSHSLHSPCSLVLPVLYVLSVLRSSHSLHFPGSPCTLHSPCSLCSSHSLHSPCSLVLPVPNVFNSYTYCFLYLFFSIVLSIEFLFF